MRLNIIWYFKKLYLFRARIKKRKKKPEDFKGREKVIFPAPGKKCESEAEFMSLSDNNVRLS